jgi:hypothetical protein
MPDPAGRAGLGRLAPAEGGLRAVQQHVLQSFAGSGRPPSAASLAAAAAPFGADGPEVLARLHAADFLRLDRAGAISAAYPFSAAPTPHLVQIEGGPAVFSMCAVDALGIAAMLGTPVTITSAEPGTGSPVTVTVPAGGVRAVWAPGGAVVFEGELAGCGPAPDAVVPSVAAEACCGVINFFTSRQSARAWAAAHPEVTGRTLSQKDALAIGRQIFGHLLHET